MTRKIILALSETEVATILEALRGTGGNDARAAMLSIRAQHYAATRGAASGECTVNLTYLADVPVGERLTAHGVELSHAAAIYRAPTPEDPTELVALLVGPDQVAIPRRVLVALAGEAAVGDVEDQCDIHWMDNR